jgi:chaperonin GroES
MTTLRALNNYLVVKKGEALSTTASGLLIIDSLASRPNTGEVISAGSEAHAKVGDRVLFCSGHGTAVKVDGAEVLVIHDNNLLGVINGTRVEPIRKVILFQFLDETGGAKGRFQERTKGNIIIPTLNTAQTTEGRWGKVTAIGPEVQGIAVGEYILVAAQKWNAAELFGDEKIWRTADVEDVVLAVTDNISDTYKF